MIIQHAASDQFDTRSSLMTWAEDQLIGNGVDEARLNAHVLLGHILHCRRSDVLLHGSDRVGAREAEQFRELIKRRCRREPLQYILGETEFMGLRFYTDTRVFIPRPETELLVEAALDAMTGYPSQVPRVLDIGTGSGNIAVSIAIKRQDVVIHALDISHDALTVAGKNMEHHRVVNRIHRILGDLFIDNWYDPRFRYDYILSNPPYISKAEFDLLQPEIRQFEPAIATTDKQDGLTFYRRIAHLGKELLNSGGSVMVEIAYNQDREVSDIFQRAGYSGIRLMTDYNKQPRILIITR